jgi:hypothetical protein
MHVPYIGVLEIIRSNDLAYPGSLKSIGYRRSTFADPPENKYRQRLVILVYVIAPGSSNLRRFLKYQRSLIWGIRLGAVEVTRRIHCQTPRSYVVTIEAMIGGTDLVSMIEAANVAKKRRPKYPEYPMTYSNRKVTEDMITQGIATMIGQSTAGFHKERIYRVPEFIAELESRLWMWKEDR